MIQNIMQLIILHLSKAIRYSFLSFKYNFYTFQLPVTLEWELTLACS